MDRKVYYSLDIAKYVMAVLILLGHTANEWAHITGIWHYILSCNFTVPTFFAISGFLFFSKMLSLPDSASKKMYYKKWSLRVGKMYLVWSLIYYAFIIAGWCINGVTIDMVLRDIHKSVVYSTYPTIWFLPALWVGVSIVFFLLEKTNKATTYLTTFILWVIGVMFGSYSGVFGNNAFFDWYMEWFITFRNGLFYGAPYALVGFIACSWSKKINIKLSAVGFVLFQCIFLAEAIFMKRVSPASDTDMALFMLPSVFCLLSFLIRFEIPYNKLWLPLRNQSMLIFCGQRLFLSAIPGLMPVLLTDSIRQLDSLSIMLLFSITVLLFAFVIERLSLKHHFLKSLY